MAQYPTPSFNSKLLVTKSNTAGEVLLGSGSMLSPLTTDWIQITASLAADSVVTRLMISLSSGGLTLGSPMYADIGIGSAASEVVKATVPMEAVFNSASTSRVTIGALVIPIRIAAGQRVAVRFSDNGLSGVTAAYALYGALYANLEGN